MNTVDGVLIPAELRDRPARVLRRYAARVRRENAAFVAAYFELEEQARRLGLTMEDLEEQARG